MSNRKPIIGVIGANNPTANDIKLAQEVGTLIANRGAILVTGGLGGIMEAASKGAASHGGTVIGILPGLEKSAANQFVTIAIPSGLGIARNILVVHTAEVLIAFPGSYGTLSEISVALAEQKVVIFMPGVWDLRKIGQVDSTLFKEAFNANQAVGLALDALRREPSENPIDLA